ncbi:transcriptional regulator [Klebsiella pneumoniae]|uniref:Transcriptional regulator n=1 Tax=Klebsiella pneumoniae TaxID=573 RepID=A0A378BBA8_KLEPN|nr:transcriptional regulator [Klebsiella pneumoniae]
MNRFTLKQLKYFVTVVETESIAEASRQLHIAQPSISIAIKNLESTFDQQLFIRHHAQGVSLTSSGRRIYDKAKELLRLSWEFEQNSRADKELVSGMISIGCFESVAPLYMPKLVAGFKKCYPEITLHLYDGEQHELMHGLHRGRFDLALVYDLELGHSINKERLNAPHKPYALLPAAHPLAQKAQVTLQELSREPMILLDAVPSKIILSPSLRKRVITRKWLTVPPPLKWCAVWWVRGWVFPVLVTRPCCDMTYDGERVVQRDIADEMPASTLIMAHLANNEPTRPTQLFMDYCRSIELTPTHA